MKPMLCNLAKNEVELISLLKSPDYCIQQKLDGERLLLNVDDNVATGFTRNGIAKTPTFIREAADSPLFDNQRIVLDGELVDGVFWVFDCPFSSIGIDPTDPYSLRHDFATMFVYKLDHLNIRIVEREDVNKQIFFASAIQQQVEGVIFKRLSGPYEFGQRNANAIKWKFVETCDAIVAELNRENKKLAVTLALFHDGSLIEVSGCKVPEKVLSNLGVGDVVEVNYLYATSDHKLYQPTWGRLRTDKSAKECTTEQLKYTNKKILQTQPKEQHGL